LFVPELLVMLCLASVYYDMLPGIIGVTVPKFELGVQSVSRALNFVSPVADFCYVERMRLLLKD
jgi:ABC-type polysaccharide/polyol phosphate export permease